MLTGEYRHTVDGKKRISIPAKFREELGKDVVVARDLRGKRLKLYSVSGWQSYIGPLMSQERRVSEKALRFLHRNASQVTVDPQGRILLSDSLMDYACIKEDAVIIGCNSYAEIWSAELYSVEIDNEDSEQICRELEEFGL